MKNAYYKWNKLNLTNMKKYIIITLIILFTNTFFGQDAFNKFEGRDDIACVNINKKMFELMSKVKMDNSDKEAQKYIELIKKLENLNIYTTKSIKITNEMKVASDKYSKVAGLNEMMKVNEADKTIKVMTKTTEGSDQIKELVLFMDGSNKGSDSVLMSLTGDFTLSDLAILTDKMNLPGGADLKKATRNK